MANGDLGRRLLKHWEENSGEIMRACVEAWRYMYVVIPGWAESWGRTECRGTEDRMQRER